MAVLGSDISIDLHIIGDVELDTIRGLVQENGRLRTELAGDLQGAVEDTTRALLEDSGIDECTLTVNLSLVQERVPGAPRQRVNARLDVEGDNEVLAAVDEALGTPERAQIANAMEECLDEHLEDRKLTDVVGTTVIVPPVQFR